MWGQGGRCCCQGWTLEVDRGSHSLRGSTIRGPRAGPSGGTSQWLAQDGRNCCLDLTVGVDRGSYSLWANPIRGPRAGPSVGNSQWWAQEWWNYFHD